MKMHTAGKFLYTEDIAGPGTVLVTRKSQLTGNYSSALLPLTREEFEDGLALWATTSGMLIQDAFPTLDRDQREFLMTGATPEEWDKAFGEEAKEDEV
jgi:hypothetical protein